MKAILLSVQPMWLEKILNGEKTVEIRKTMPKCELPIDVYLYCTKGRDLCFDNHYKKFGLDVQYSAIINNGKTTSEKYPINGKVVAKFTLQEVDAYDDDTIYSFSQECYAKWNEFGLDRTCIHPEDFENYANGNWLYGWHITDLVVFDKPMELHEFKIIPSKRLCQDCFVETNRDNDPLCPACDERSLSRPPKSYQYVEVGK